MTARSPPSALILSALLASCGGSASHRPTTAQRATHPTRPVATNAAPADPVPRPPTLALVTAETENRLLVVQLPSGRVIRRIRLPSDPEDVAAPTEGSVAVVTSAAAGKVALLDGPSLRPAKILGGFGSPHIVEFAPDGEHAYVTDDRRGTVTTIDVVKLRATSTIDVGAGAHHMSFDVTHRRGWVALGESARQIVMLDTTDLDHPRIIGRFNPGFAVHDLAFSPDGNQVWVTSSVGPEVTVFDGVDRQPSFRVHVGRPPQHVAFNQSSAYLTSGYGATIEQADAATGRILAKAKTPYGSFELAADGRYVVTSSLLRGTLAIYTSNLRLLRVVHLAPATREVALSPRAGSRP
jgi:YVTN family beta-propeller protein